MTNGNSLSVIDNIIKEGEEKLLTARAIADVLAEAQLYLDENGSTFTENTILHTVNAICRYQREAEEIFANAHRKINALKSVGNVERGALDG